MHKTVVERRLSHREREFVHFYLISNTAKEAAKKAGYRSNPGSQASRLLRRFKVQKAISSARRDLAERNEIDQDKVLRMMVSSYDRASSEGDAMTMLKAARDLGVLCGLYHDTNCVTR